MSKQSGVAVATIKFYLREELLPPGTRTAHNQVDYGESHLARVRFVRILSTVGQLTLAQVKEILAAVDMKGLSVQGLCHVVNRALFADQRIPPAPEVDVDSARARVDTFLEARSWRVDSDAPGRQTLARVLAALQYLGWDCDVDVFAPLAEAIELATAQERTTVPAAPAETVVARTVLFEVALTAIRRMAVDHLLASSHRRGYPLPPRVVVDRAGA